MKILLVKLSSLGDVVHTLPVLEDIRAALPRSEVDWVVEKPFAPLLSLLRQATPAGPPLLRRAIECEFRRWRKTPLDASTWSGLRGFHAQLRADAYDAVIDLQGLSKSALVAWLARLASGGRRFALANRTEGSSYEAPTRWVADAAIAIAPHVHAVQRARELAAKALGYGIDPEPNFGIKTALAQGIRALAAIEMIATDRTVVLVHGTSRPDKEWPKAHWVALGRRLKSDGFRLALVHGSAPELAASRQIAADIDAESAGIACVVWPMLALDQLAAALARCCGVVGVDSGVSHIAMALGLPHVQIYNRDTAWRTGPPAYEPGPQRQTHQPQRQASVFAQPTPEVATVLAAWRAALETAP
jgi:heptosyltransferase I